MNNKQYIERRNGLNETIGAAKQSLKNLDVAYIAENRTFLDGDKIKITEPSCHATRIGGGIKTVYIPERVRYAYIESAYVDDLGRIFYYLKAAKKDGTISKQNDYCTRVDWFTLVDSHA